MSSLVKVHYKPLEIVAPNLSVEFLEHMLTGKLPAFIVKNAGLSVAEAIETTGLKQALTQHAYAQSEVGIVPFSYAEDHIIADDFVESGTPLDPDWYLFGVTQLHQDAEKAAENISLNNTIEGKVQYRIHRPQPAFDPSTRYDQLCLATGTILINGEVDPEVINPHGWSGVASASDLLVLDTYYVHLGESIETPRISEAVFYNRQ